MRSPTHPHAVVAAQDTLSRLGIDAPHSIDVELIAAHHNICLHYRPMSQQEGHLLRAKNSLIVIDERARRSEKWRFVVAHELGHYVLHEAYDQLLACTDADARRGYATSPLEQEANTFACELLMPTSMFTPLCDDFGSEPMPTLEHLSALAQTFGTSLTATALRFAALTHTPCAVVYAQAGRIAWIRKTSAFALPLRPHVSLHRDSYARALRAGERLPREPLPIDACVWSKSRRHGRSLLLFEDSIHMKEYDATLTLLWHDDTPDVHA